MRQHDRPAQARSSSSLSAALRRRLLAPALAVLALGAASLVAPSPAAAQTPGKIAVIDMRRAVLETEEGLRVQATLKKLFDSRQVELDSKQNQLQRDKEELEKDAQAGKVAKEALQKRYEQLQKQFADLQAISLDYQREMQRKEAELTNPIVNKVMGIVRRIASQEGYEVVLDKAGVAYFRSDLELTDRAIQMVNSGQAGDAGGTPAKGAPGAAPPKPAPPPGPPGSPAAPKPATPPPPPPKK
jgi:outer membrane protein